MLSGRVSFGGWLLGSKEINFSCVDEEVESCELLLAADQAKDNGCLHNVQLDSASIDIASV